MQLCKIDTLCIISWISEILKHTAWMFFQGYMIPEQYTNYTKYAVGYPRTWNVRDISQSIHRQECQTYLVGVGFWIGEFVAMSLYCFVHQSCVLHAHFIYAEKDGGLL